MRRFQPNTYRIDGDDVYITLTRGQEAVIDRSDLDIALRLRWCATPTVMGGFYAMTTPPKGLGLPQTVYLHRYLLGVAGNVKVDHINHDTLDNRRSNLRLTTNSQNNINRKGAYSSSKVGVRGVSVHHTKHNDLYIFRCSIKTCPLAKYFPLTDEGLAAARHLSDSHYAATGYVTKPAPIEAAPVVRHKQQAPNAYRVEGDTAVLTLTQGYETRIDLADLEAVQQHRWFAHRDNFGTVRAKSKMGYLHRFLLGSDARHSRHLNGDHLDNRRINLTTTADSTGRSYEH